MLKERSGPGRGYLGLASAILSVSLITLIGYFTFVAFVVSFTPNPASLGLILFAAVAGVATFFNPCSFPFLPSYLTSYYSAGMQGEGRDVYHGFVAALGLVTFNLLLGASIGALGEAFGTSFALAGPQPSPFSRVLRGAVGSLLVALGLVSLSGRGFGPLSWIGQRFLPLQGKSPTLSLYTYGFGYNAIGIGCAGPFLAGLMAFSFASGGLGPALLAFLVFSLVMAALMIFVSLLAGRKALVAKLRASSRSVKKWGSIVQATVGAFLIFTALPYGLEIYTRTFFPS